MGLYYDPIIADDQKVSVYMFAHERKRCDIRRQSPYRGSVCVREKAKVGEIETDRDGCGLQGGIHTWFIPALAKRRVGSSWGMVDEEGTKVCPWLSRKYEIKVSRTLTAVQ